MSQFKFCVVIRRVCFSWPQKCCGWSLDINVKNCSGYYVYKLRRIRCNRRYCGNAGAGKLH